MNNSLLLHTDCDVLFSLGTYMNCKFLYAPSSLWLHESPTRSTSFRSLILFREVVCQNLKADDKQTLTVKTVPWGRLVLSKVLPLCCSYGLLGPSGCGKTTLLKCIVGTLKISRGHITVLGKPPAFPGHDVPGKMVGYMPQVNTTSK